ncbi:AbrB/MazE/SpoVT family DNA-binding domain-containing protein [Clostridium weizhouense]|uniref:AbrB/MazE/SpoVT family DNA-binding domain-containing protein n=1 Tax=Clostridium weizhouense TaxID=2859781 RepID=A0ABS7AKF1_9CLOT|nr:AbrB/MazE/SpoVT family DNA-binding domain-containing protein [Clostridium weizhouense]MBW6409024.1 AbrB/MazE/SpoVT family DNA-binding domain-containing protein [Clostridium weizhouense]
MKAIGIVRKVDELGRVVLPKELRKLFNINGGAKGTGDSLEIYVEGDNIILKKYIQGCHCCGNSEDLVEYMGFKLCPKCLRDFNDAKKITDKFIGK